MKKDKNIKSYTTTELKAKRADSRTDLTQVDATTDEELERRIVGDEDEGGGRPDWARARLVLPDAKQDVHLSLDREIINFFKERGKGHLSRMQEVLKAYVDDHKPQVK
ncbi:MAG: BrnA antitoxin family protein [Deltaproteobacteria bacterium]|nr:BrnA antitoxin family protein [Deltaproteobacteria bacterium]